MVPLFQDDNVAEGYDLYSDQSLHHKILINENIKTNEFISMLQSRFFPHIDIEDMCVYRLNQTSSKSNIHSFYQYFNKLEYKAKEDSPLFGKSRVFYISGPVL